jgi:hypothetical protein
VARPSSQAYPEIEFLDINLRKDSSFLLRAIHSPLYWRILLPSQKKPDRNHTLALKNNFKKSAKQEILNLVVNRIFLNGENSVENWTKTRV